MFLHVTKAVHVADHRIELTFSDGLCAEVDLSHSLDGPIFDPLLDVKYFESFSLIGNTIAWPNGADYAPEYLHKLATAPTNT